MQTKKIIFKIGGNAMSDIRAVFQNPKLVQGGTHTIYLKSIDDIPKMLTREKLRLLTQLSEEEFECTDVKTLTKNLHRKQEAVSRDLNSLELSGLITKVKKGKNVYPKLTAKEIVIQLS